jgi:glycosyltransferase involved in cell wall biosynthesis
MSSPPETENARMINGPLVSVVVPTYNRAAAVARAIDSILRQTYSRIEVVVVDDGSTDNTAEILKSAQNTDKRVVCCSNTRGKGAAGARNTGVAMASGEYVAFLDDDDEYDPDKIARQLEIFMNDPHVDVVVSGVPARWCDRQAEIHWVSLEFHPNRVFDGCYIMCSRAALKDVTFRCNYMEWRDLAFQMYAKGVVVRLSHERLVRKNSSAGSLSKQKEAMFLSALANAQSYYQYSKGKQNHSVFRGYLANCYKNCANYNLKQGRLWKAFRNYMRSFSVERRIRNVIPFG